MKTNNMTEIKIDQLEKVTGGLTNAVGPVNVGVRVKAVGPVAYPYKAVGPVNYPYKAEIKSCDPALTGTGPLNGTGPLDGTGPLTEGTRIPPKCVGPVAYPYMSVLDGTGPLGYETGPL